MIRVAFVFVRMILATLALVPAAMGAQQSPDGFFLKPARVFDGTDGQLHEGWGVVVRKDRIAAVGPANQIDSKGTQIIDLPGLTLLPGLIEAHSHVLLHPYN